MANGSRFRSPLRAATASWIAANHNERLTLTGIQTVHYDVKLGDKKGHVCTIKNVEVQEGNPVIIREQDLTSWTRSLANLSP